jgi:hypothetical protein
MTAPALSLVSRDNLVKPPFAAEIGTEMGWAERLYYGFATDPRDKDRYLVEYSDWESRDLAEMLKRSARARQIESVLTQPIMAAEYKIEPIKGDTGEAELLTSLFSGDELGEGCATPLQQVIDQCTSAIGYKKAFFELVWGAGTGEFDGKVIYERVAWRPQTTCRPMRHPQSGVIVGFEQEPYYTGVDIARGMYPYKIENKPGHYPNAFVYVNGKRRDPINGVSELEIAYWAHKTKQRVLLLWFQYLESVSLPIKVVKASTKEEALAVAQTVGSTRGGGTAPVYSDAGPNAIDVSQLDVSGKGAEQFLAAIKWIDSEAANSILAGFLDLPSAAADGRGSNALSEDASDFFLQSEEARVSELATSIRIDLFAPLIRANFGRGAKVPKLSFEPLTAEDKTRAFTLLQSTMAGRDPQSIPGEFVAMLAAKVAGYLGMDTGEVEKAFRDAEAQLKVQQAAQQAKTLAPPAPNPIEQMQTVHAAVSTAHKLLRNANTAPGTRPNAVPTAPGR